MCACSDGTKIILPMEPCVYCAQKHLSTAYSQAQASTAVSITALGQTVLAIWHLQKEHPMIAGSITEILYAYQTGGPFNVPPILRQLHQLILQKEHGTVPTAEQPWQGIWPGSCRKDIEPHMKYAQLSICAAWMLARQAGYEDLNKNNIVAQLVAAQWHCHKYDYPLAQRLSSIRHLAQRGLHSKISTGDWLRVCDMARTTFRSIV